MTALAYATPPSGVHLTADWRSTLCGEKVLDVPLIPRNVEPRR